MSRTPRPTALVTGASSGIGRSFAEHLAAAGFDLVVTARRTGALSDLAEEIGAAHGVGVEILEADLGEPEGLSRVVSRIADGEPIEMLVNNAGYAARGRVGAMDGQAFDAMLKVNVTALAHLSNAAAARMTAAGRGTIVNVASGTVFMQLPGNAAYGASKNFVMAFTRVMQMETEGTGVRVQLLVPGVIATDFHRVAGNDLSNFPAERVMSADDLVVASLRALELGESVCIPSLPEVSTWTGYVEAERRVAADASRDRIAARYH